MFNLTMRNRIYTRMTSQRTAERQSIHSCRSCYTNFSLLFRLVICSFTCKQPFRLTFIIDQHSIFCVNRKFNIGTFETLASWYFKNEEIGEAVLIIIHIGLLTIMTLASTNSMYFSPQFWPFNICTGYNHRQNVRLDCSLKCLCVIIRDSLPLSHSYFQVQRDTNLGRRYRSFCECPQLSTCYFVPVPLIRTAVS